MTPHQTLADIKGVMSRMIRATLSDEQHYPVLASKGGNIVEINIAGAPDLSASMKSKSYDEIYADLVAAKAFNLKLVDGALIQMCYQFKANTIISHRLSFFPSPLLSSYEEAQILYDGDENFADIIDQFFVRFPIRFDFSAGEDEHVDVDHPKSHMTLGQYKNCRIPLDSPLTPTRFMQFVARNFYFSAHKLISFDQKIAKQKFAKTISTNETKITHIVA